MKTILITGPIGSGKSTVRQYLESKSYPVYDCDSRCKVLYETVPGLKELLERRLGLPFSQWGAIFSDSGKRSELERTVYPVLAEDIREWRESCKSPLCFVESAVAAGKPQFKGLYDGIWLVCAPYELRVRRNPKAAERDRVQEFDGSAADVVIENSSTLEELYKTIDKYLK